MIGGAEKQCELLCSQLCNEVEWVTLLTHRYSSELAKFEIINNIAVERLGVPSTKTDTGTLKFYFDLFSRLFAKRQKFDIVHCHTAGITGLWVSTICRLLRKPVLLKLTAEGELSNQFTPIQYSDLNLRFIVKTTLRRLLAQVGLRSNLTHVVTLTQRGRNEACAYDVSNVHLVPNGVDLSKYINLTKKIERKKTSIVFGYIGRLTAEKGTHFLVESFDFLFSINIQIKLMIAGSGERQIESSEEKIKELQKRWPENVRYEGSLSDSQYFMSGLDAYISASTYEGLPNSVLEAVASGLPCILSDIDGHREIERLNPDASILFFEPNDLASFYSQISRFLHSPLLKNSSISSRFDIKNISKSYLDIYLKMINSSAENLNG